MVQKSFLSSWPILNTETLTAFSKSSGTSKGELGDIITPSKSGSVEDLLQDTRN